MMQACGSLSSLVSRAERARMLLTDSTVTLKCLALSYCLIDPSERQVFAKMRVGECSTVI